MEAGTLERDLTGDAGSVGPPTEGDGLYIEGSSGQLGFEVGGQSPTGSSLRIVGGKVEVEGTFRKGETARFTIEVEVGEVSFRDRRDSATGQVIACDRAHRGRITSISRA